MKIELNEITIREVAEGYCDNAEEGVIGYGGKLNIRPRYQREFVYDDAKRNAVIDTIKKGFPLNVMYWIVKDDGTYEVLDGQQRTISFCRYVSNIFTIKYEGYPRGFCNLPVSDQQQILDYKLMIYFCEGNDKEKLDWFKVVNIAGERLYDQELRNAVYTGPWLTHAKAIFSKNVGAAYGLGSKYLTGSPIRQDYLETALRWINKGDIEGYMSIHQHDPNANELWTYYRNVIDWVMLTFKIYRSEMKGLDWGSLYDEFHDKLYDTEKLEKEIEALMIDDDVTNKKGIYTFVLNRNEKHLNIRAFTESQRRQAFEKQKGVCVKCGETFKIDKMDADHITPWSKGGKTNVENCQMLCKPCNRAKSGK